MAANCLLFNGEKCEKTTTSGQNCAELNRPTLTLGDLHYRYQCALNSHGIPEPLIKQDTIPITSADELSMIPVATCAEHNMRMYGDNVEAALCGVCQQFAEEKDEYRLAKS